MKSISIRVLARDGSVETETTEYSLPCLIGRDPTCTVVVSDRSCSGRHVLIEERNGEIHLVDQNSRNGVFDQQGQKLNSLKVTGLTRVRLAKCWLEISSPKMHEHTEFMVADFKPPPIFPGVPIKSGGFHLLQPPPRIMVMGAGTAGSSGGLSSSDISGDWVEKTILLSSSARVFAFFSLVLFVASVVWLKDPVIVGLGNFSAILFLSLLSGTLTYVLARLFPGKTTFRNSFFIYCSFYTFLLLGYAIFDTSTRLHPEGLIWPQLIPRALAGGFLLLFLLNLRLIWDLRTKTLNWIGGILVGSLLVLLARTPLESNPRWKTRLPAVNLETSAKRVPASAYVTTEQFISEMGQSLETLRTSATNQR
jgi:hypothetical protein